MDCAICHRTLRIHSEDRDARIASLEDGVALCRRCAVDVTLEPADELIERPLEIHGLRPAA